MCLTGRSACTYSRMKVSTDGLFHMKDSSIRGAQSLVPEGATLVFPTVHTEDLCTGLPPEFAAYMRYAKSLPHGRKPKYAELKRIFCTVAAREGIEYDSVFDWTVHMYLQQKRHL